MRQSFDVRLDKEAPAAAAYLERLAVRADFAPSEARLAARVEGMARMLADDSIEIAMSPVAGALEIVRTKPGTGFLTGPSDDRVGALRGFVAAHAQAFGVSADEVTALDVVADYENPAGNMAWVELEQKINGIPVFRGYIRGGFTARGELAATTGQLATNLEGTSLATLPSLGAADAVSRAAAHVGWQVAASALTQKSIADGGRRVTLSRGPMADDARAWQVYFPLAPGVARLAWATEIVGNPDAFLVVLDAEDGSVLFRKNLVDYQTQAVTYAIYNDDSPAPSSPTPALPGANFQAPFIARTTDTRIGNEAPYNFNNLGWITDGANITDGNNVEAGLDRDGINGVDAPVTGSGMRVFDFAYNPETDEPLTLNYQRGDVTNMFFWSNRFHDETYRLGFTEAARNFQTDNFGRGGAGNDRVSAEGQDSSSTNNADFFTPADGGRGRMQMFIWTGSTPDRSGDLDRDIIAHEFGHGVSNRLHANAAGLSNNMSRGMGEGWSDFLARSLFATPDESATGLYTVGGWATHFPPTFTDNYYYGIRRFPYVPISQLGGPLNRPFNPMTFADIDATQFNLGDGAFPPSLLFASANVDQVHNIGQVWASMLFEVRARFITRLGHATGNQRILQFVMDGMKLDPAGPTLVQARDAIITAANAGGGTAADIADIWAGFAARGLGVLAEVTNPGTGANNTRVIENFNVPGDPTLPAFSINDVSVLEGNAGTTTATFTVTLANPTGNTPRVDFSTADGTAFSGQTFSSAVAVTIPGSGSGAPAGAPATPYPTTLDVAGMTGTIQRLSVRLNALSHTFPSDIDMALVGPGGEKVMLMSDAGGSGGISAVNLTIADGAPLMTSGQLVTGTYAPTDLTPGESLVVPAPPAPYSTTLSVFNGTNPNGTWNLYIQDDAAADVGILGGWSLTITTASADYVPAIGTLDFPPGTTTRTVNVTVNGDLAIEPNETFFVNLSNVRGAVIGDAQGVGTILNDENAPPTSVDDAYNTPFNTPLNVAPPGVLANDNTNGGGPMTAVLASGPPTGALILGEEGGFTYTPAAGFSGVTSFTYRAANVNGPGNIATVTITVSAATTPTSVNDAYGTAFNTPLSVAAPGVLGNDNSNGGGAMTAAVVTTTTNGALALDAEGSFSYTPNAGFVGADSFTYRASNAGGPGNIATVTIGVAEPTTPQPPTNLYVASVVGNLVTLRWTPSPIGPDADNFVLEGGLSPGQVLASLATGSASPIFTFVAPTGAFFARVHQISGADRSAASNEIRLYVNVPVTPSAPAGLVGVVNGSSLDLAWRNTFAGGPPASLFLDVTGSLAASVPLPALEQASFPFVPGGSYTLSLRAANAGGTSGSSNAVSIVVPSACTGAPNPPEDFLFYKAGGGASGVWNPSASGPAATSYIVNVVGPFSISLPTSLRSVSGVPPPGTYSMSVIAVNACGTSAPTAVQTITFP